MSLSISELSDLLLEQGLKDQVMRSNILKAAKELEESKKEEKGAEKAKSKYVYTVLVRSDNADLRDALENTECFIAKTEDTVDQATIPDRIRVGAIEQNRSVKKKGKIATYADYFRYIKSKFHKGEGAGVKNVAKDPVRIVALAKSEIDFN